MSGNFGFYIGFGSPGYNRNFYNGGNNMLGGYNRSGFYSPPNTYYPEFYYPWMGWPRYYGPRHNRHRPYWY